MKHITLFLLACLALNTNLSAADNDKSVDSKISKVTVFLSGAQVYRSAGFYLQPGTHRIILDGVSPYIDQNSIQAKGKGAFTIMDVAFETHYPQPNTLIATTDEMPKVEKRKMHLLEDSLMRLNYEIEELLSIKEVYNMERKMLLNNGTVKGTGRVNDSIPLLKDAMAFFHDKMTQINMELFKIKKKETALNIKKNGMTNRLSNFQNWRQHNQLVVDKPKGPNYRLVLTINNDKAVQGNVEVSYIVSQAGWVPSYDLRADHINAPISLNYKAEIFQNTGIVWDKIPLTLSTGNPYSSHVKPTLTPWYISYNQPNYYNQQKKIYSSQRAESNKIEEQSVRDKSVDGTAMGGVAGYQDDLNIQARTSIDYVQAIDNMVMAEYKITLPYTIESNNKKYMVGISSKTLDADYHLALVPKLDRNAFLVASVTDWDDLNLVPAKARIYYDGTYVGESYIDPIAMEDTLKLAMGRDNSVSAVRKKLKDKEKEKIIGDNKVKETYFEITLKNSHGYTVDLIVEDQVPISNHADIKVEDLDLDKADKNEFTGILTWRTKLKAGGSDKLKFGYTIKYDKTKNLSMF